MEKHIHRNTTIPNNIPNNNHNNSKHTLKKQEKKLMTPGVGFEPTRRKASAGNTNQYASSEQAKNQVLEPTAIPLGDPGFGKSHINFIKELKT